MFEDILEQKPKRKPKVVHFILNGRPEKLFTHEYSKPLRGNEIEGLVERQWSGARFKGARFFSIEGVEIMEEELVYVRNGARIYVSRGEDFDGTRNFGQYQLIKPLGEGGFGHVWLARSSINDSQAAIKYACKDVAGARDIDMLFREVETLKALSHPNIVSILNCYTLANMQLIVVMEYLAGGELLDLLKERGTFDESTARKLFAQIIEAISHCHREGIIHRDLKLENILLESKGQLKVKVADFGISGVVDTLNPDLDVGTLRYMAPEVLNLKEKSNTAAVDVWACGVMLYCMVYGRLPFAESTPALTTQAIINGRFTFPQKPFISSQCQNLITTMLTYDPKERPSIYEVQGHPWILGIFSAQTLAEDRVIEDSLPDYIRSSPQKCTMKIGQFRKRLPAIPRRLERTKQQVLEQLRSLKGSRGRLQWSDSKWRAGSPPRYMQNIRCKQEEGRGVRRRQSFVTGMWK